MKKLKASPAIIEKALKRLAELDLDIKESGAQVFEEDIILLRNAITKQTALDNQWEIASDYWCKRALDAEEELRQLKAPAIAGASLTSIMARTNDAIINEIRAGSDARIAAWPLEGDTWSK